MGIDTYPLPIARPHEGGHFCCYVLPNHNLPPATFNCNPYDCFTILIVTYFPKFATLIPKRAAIIKIALTKFANRAENARKCNFHCLFVIFFNEMYDFTHQIAHNFSLIPHRRKYTFVQSAISKTCNNFKIWYTIVIIQTTIHDR